MRTSMKAAALLAAVLLASHVGGNTADAQSIAPGGIYAGAGTYYITPVWTHNPAYAIQDPTVGGVTPVNQVDFDYDLDIAPLFWLGASDAATGLGLQARGWWYDDDETIAFTHAAGTSVRSARPLGLGNITGVAGSQHAFRSGLELDVIDALATWAGQGDLLAVQFGTGVRWARIAQEYETTLLQGANLTAEASHHDFEGIGPQIAMESRVQLTQCLSLLTDLRYSMLFGTSDHDVVSSLNGVVGNVRHQNNDATRSIFEVELGGEYTRPLGGAELFAQGAFVAMFFPGAGNSANNDPITVLVDPEVSDKNADLAMYGIRATAGIRY